MKSIVIAVIAAAAGYAGAVLYPVASFSNLRLPAWMQLSSASSLPGPGKPSDKHGDEEGHKEGEGKVALSDAQIEAANITLAPAEPGTLIKGVAAPGVVLADPDRMGRVAAKVIGTVAQMRKRLGDSVVKGEVIAVIASREVADAKSEYLAATANFQLQKTLFEREQILWDKRISPEQQFLRARMTNTEAQLRLELARQKLAALDLGEREIQALPTQPVGNLPLKEIRAPIDGRVIDRRVDLGAPVGGEGQEKELYVIADLSRVWVDLAVPVGDLGPIREGQRVRVVGTETDPVEGALIFISPVLNPETRSARVIASFDNTPGWRSGSFVTARIALEELPVGLKIPRDAIQTVKGEQVVFVRGPEGFEKRVVTLGRSDEAGFEVLSGLVVGDLVAATNSFVLKAELGKAEAAHDD